MEKKFRKPINEILLPDILDGDGDIIPIIADGDDGELEDVEVPVTTRFTAPTRRSVRSRGVHRGWRTSGAGRWRCAPPRADRHSSPSPDRKSTRLNSSHANISYD